MADNIENLVLASGVAGAGGNVLGNTITGNSSANTLFGGDGNDTLDGSTGADILYGGTGDDTYIVDNIGDGVNENLNEGTDLVKSSVTITLSSNVENLTLTGTPAINGTGNELNNILDGSLNTAANVLTGGLGNDAYIVGVGDTVVETEATGIELVQSLVSFTLGANLENLTLTASGNTNATGNSLNNILIGNAGANVLDGKAGTDTMTGGAGNDTYVIDDLGDIVNEAAAAGTDTVQSYLTYSLLGTNLENLTLLGTGAINATGSTVANTLDGSTQ